MDERKEIKIKIQQDWQTAFPELSAFAKNRFYKIVGPIIIGIDLIPMPRGEGYQPHFVCYPLWKPTLGECIDVPIVLKVFRNRRNLVFSIPYERHHLIFSEVVGCVKDQTPFLFKSELHLKDIMDLIDSYSRKPPLGAALASYLQASLKRNKLLIALYTGDKIHIESIFNLIKTREWDLNHFKMWNVDFETWMKGIEDVISQRQVFLTTIQHNKEDKKLTKIHTVELIS